MLRASFYGTKRLKRLARVTQKLIKSLYIFKPLCPSAHAQTHANIWACRICAILTVSVPLGKGTQAQEVMDKMLFLLYVHVGQHFSLPLGLIGKEMLYVGIVTAYYRDF